MPDQTGQWGTEAEPQMPSLPSGQHTGEQVVLDSPWGWGAQGMWLMHSTEKEASIEKGTVFEHH